VTQTRLALVFLAAAALAAIVFVAALHPWSGSLGGLVYLLSSWALPNVFVGALALGLAWLLPFPIIARCATALLLSFLLGLNTALPVIADILDYRQTVSFEIRRAATWSTVPSANTVAIKRRPWPSLHTRPFGPRVRVGSDEGCGCMYFLDAWDSTYSDRVIGVLAFVTGRYTGVRDYATQTDPAQEQRDVHIDLTVWREGQDYRTLIELFDRGEKIAAFAHTHIPSNALIERRGIGRERLAVNFWENAMDILLHGNLWSDALNSAVPNYFPDREVDAFLRNIVGQPAPP
jgi:hypothetical protein